MAGEQEPAKALLPYLQRADELQKHEPLVAYYCRLYAMDRGMKISQSQRTKTTNALLASLIKQLEKDKKSLNLGPDDNLHLEGFALSVFAKADKQDRAGRADLNTAKTFYAASIFFEILNQFGPVQPDIEQKQKYAAWKAADIRKALKEGRTPIPGPPIGDDDLSLPSVETLSLGTNLGGQTNSSPQIHERLDRQHSSNIPGSPSYPTQDFHQPPPPAITRSDSSVYYSQYNHQGLGTNLGGETNSSPQIHERLDRQHSLNISGSTSGFPINDFHQPPPPAITRSDSSVYSSPYNHQELPQQHHHLPSNYSSEHLPGNYSSEQIPPQNYPSEHNNYYQQPPHQQHFPIDNPHSYPNFQSYPSLNDSTLPSVPTHEASYYQGSESSFSSHSSQPHSTNNYAAAAVVPQYGSGSRNGSVSEASAPKLYQYDSNYQPSPEMIAEAHKAARFAVGALAFDEVPVAVEHLRKALELLTNPSVSP